MNKDIYIHTHTHVYSMSDSLRPHGLQSARLFCPWDFSDKNTGVDCQFYSRDPS